jgi:hypothetical protein
MPKLELAQHTSSHQQYWHDSCLPGRGVKDGTPYPTK